MITPGWGNSAVTSVGCRRMFDKMSSESSLSHFVKSHRPNRARSHLWDSSVMRISLVLKNLAMA